MTPRPEVDGDNYPVAAGFAWDPRAPWRHRTMTSPPAPRWLCWIGWWAVVMVLMGALLLLTVHDGFSEEGAAASLGTPSAKLIVCFHDGAVRYPEGAPWAFVDEVEFVPPSLGQLNARWGLIAVERVRSAATLTPWTFRLVFASRVGLERVLASYQRHPAVTWAAAAMPTDRGGPRPPAAGPEPPSDEA